jgi:PKD repeat protein
MIMTIGAILNPKSFLLSGLFFLIGLIPEINAAPFLSNIEQEPLIYNEGSGEVNITGTIRIDAGFFMRSATIRIASGYNPDEDVLSYAGTNSISAYWDKSSGSLTLTGFTSVSRYQTALRNVKYQNANLVRPSTDTRAVSFTVNDGSNSNTVYREINVIPSNRRPLLSKIESSLLIYCNTSGNIILTSSVIVGNDNPNLTSATIVIESGYVQNADALMFNNQNGITGSWDNSSGTLSLFGSSSVANYQEALRSIRFGTVNAQTGTRRVTLMVNDGEQESNVVERSLEVYGRLTAAFRGGGLTCAENIGTIDLSVTFTGTAPWSFTLLRNGQPDQGFDNITKNPYSFNVANPGNYKLQSFEDAHCKGDTAGSGSVNILEKPAPTATISGTDTICSGGTAELQIVFTGMSPWTVTVSAAGTEPFEITSNTSIYSLEVKDPGTYSLSKLSDALCKGSVSGSGRVLLHQPPTAVITGDVSVCEGTPARISVSLTGAAPWKYSYRISSNNPVEKSNVRISPDYINALKEGTYTLTAVSDRICSGTVSGSVVVTVLPTPDVQINGIKEVYTKQSNEWVELTAKPGGGQFSGSGVIPYSEKWYFIPALPPVGVHNIVYQYRVSPESCYGYDTIAVRIIEKSAEIRIESNRTRFCKNDAPFLVRGLNLISDSIGTFTISGGTGLTDHHNNTATVYPSQLSVNQYTISYSPNEVLPAQQVIEIGNALSADFTWNMECFENNRAVIFNNTTYSPFGFLSDTSFNWRVETDTGVVYLETRNVSHTYTLPGIYRVKLEAENSYGCVDSITRNFHLKPVIALAGENYFENFEEPSDWIPGSATGSHSWRLGDPDAAVNTFSGASSGEKCWFTHIPGISAPAEESRITGPCFDFRGTEKPTLVAQIWRAFTDSKDGANIQYTIDDGVSWIPIGNLNDGINWFNGYYGTPGSEKKGWTSIKDQQWTESRHSLDFLKGRPKVQFRIAYSASGNALGNDGFAFDDFQIVERNRMILIEHFTNSSDVDCYQADSVLDALTSNHPSNVINLQYHTSYPPNDPFNADNPVVPTTRQFYYNLSNVPFAIINGGKESSQRIDFQTTHLNQEQVIIQSLYDSDFNLNIRTMKVNNILYIEPTIAALADVPDMEISLRIAVIHPEIKGITGNNGDTLFRNVVRDMIPGPAGTTIYRPWNMGETLTLVQAWEISNEVESDSLRVIAFIQNESSREIIQAAMDTRGIFSGNDDPEIITPFFFEVFPNPAQSFIRVALGDEKTEELRVLIYNNLGELVYTNKINRGTNQIEIDTGHLPDGLYVIKVFSINNHKGTQKFIISK